MLVRMVYVLLTTSDNTEVEGVFEEPEDATTHAEQEYQIHHWFEPRVGVKQADGYRHGGERITVKIIEQRVR